MYFLINYVFVDLTLNVKINERGLKSMRAIFKYFSNVLKMYIKFQKIKDLVQ